MVRSSTFHILLCWALAVNFTLGDNTGSKKPRRTRLRSSAWGFPGQNATFDYIVVGGGNTGLAIAARLAEKASVAVIEAGGFHDQDNSNGSVVPAYALTGLPFIAVGTDYARQPLMDWDLTTVPMPGVGGRVIHYAQAKTLGGCTTLNTLSYLRATKGSHEEWARLAGDRAYTFDNMLPYFRRSVTLTPPDWKKRNAPNATFTYDASAFASGKGGPVQVSFNPWVDPAATWFAKAVQTEGFPMSTEGFSSGTLSGFSSWVPLTVDPVLSERSTARAYLEDVILRTQIIVYHQTQALKVNFDPSKKATSVTVTTRDLEYTLSARKEIIISAGVFHSPQLLMVSGVGPAATLQSHSIPVVVDLPGVGQNLQDPFTFSIATGLGSLPTGTGYVTSSSPEIQASILRDYLEDARGPLTSVGGYLSFEKLPKRWRQGFGNRTAALLGGLHEDWPEIELIGAGVPDGTGSGTTGLLAGVLLRPFSLGSVTISSASMLDKPVIDLGWLTDPADQELAVATFKRLREVLNSTALAPVRVGPELVPGFEAVRTDQEILEFVKANGNHIWHASSTCSMGKKGDKSAVVDSRGRVFGVKGLRVADMSVLPVNLPNHPQGTMYALGEKIAEDILRGADK